MEANKTHITAKILLMALPTLPQKIDEIAIGLFVDYLLIVCCFDDCLIINPFETEHYDLSKGCAHYLDTGWQRAGIYAGAPNSAAHC